MLSLPKVPNRSWGKSVHTCRWPRNSGNLRYQVYLVIWSAIKYNTKSPETEEINTAVALLWIFLYRKKKIEYICTDHQCSNLYLQQNYVSSSMVSQTVSWVSSSVSCCWCCWETCSRSFPIHALIHKLLQKNTTSDDGMQTCWGVDCGDAKF